MFAREARVMDWSSAVSASTFISERMFCPRIGSCDMIVKEMSCMFCWKRLRTLRNICSSNGQHHVLMTCSSRWGKPYEY